MDHYTRRIWQRIKGNTIAAIVIVILILLIEWIFRL